MLDPTGSQTVGTRTTWRLVQLHSGLHLQSLGLAEPESAFLTSSQMMLPAGPGPRCETLLPTYEVPVALGCAGEPGMHFSWGLQAFLKVLPVPTGWPGS